VNERIGGPILGLWVVIVLNLAQLFLNPVKFDARVFKQRSHLCSTPLCGG